MSADPASPRRATLTVQELADELRITYEQARAMCNRGEIRFVRVGRYIRIPRTALDELLGAAS